MLVQGCDTNWIVISEVDHLPQLLLTILEPVWTDEEFRQRELAALADEAKRAVTRAAAGGRSVVTAVEEEPDQTLE